VRIPEGSFAANPTVVLSATSRLPIFCKKMKENEIEKVMKERKKTVEM
jgi:hypothetical protein